MGCLFRRITENVVCGTLLKDLWRSPTRSSTATPIRFPVAAPQVFPKPAVAHPHHAKGTSASEFFLVLSLLGVREHLELRGCEVLPDELPGVISPAVLANEREACIVL